jgi:hypothetical protein
MTHSLDLSMNGDPPDSDVDFDRLFERELSNTPVDWRRLRSIDAPLMWAELDAWVRWLASRYAIDARELPPCWWSHGALVEELSALRGAHRAALEPSQHPGAALDWHRSLWDSRSRLRDLISRTGCTAREHRASDAPQWTQPSSAYADELAAHVAADTDARHRAELLAALGDDR